MSQRTILPALLLVLAAVIAACGGRDEPATLPSKQQVSPRVEPPAPAPQPPPALPPPIREVPATGGRGQVKVIDPGEPEDRAPTLVEASRLAKQQKRDRARLEPIAEINDDNLAEYAEGAEVIVLESAPAGDTAMAARSANGRIDGGGAQGLTDDIRGESFWRDRALELRMTWRRLVDEISEMELESASLRQQFYAEEDPYIRDSQIKPAWDRVLDRLDATRQRALQTERELTNFLAEGRRAGALQGWLNQGWELEPTDEERRALRRAAGEPATTDPGEPDTVEPAETSAVQESGGNR